MAVKDISPDPFILSASYGLIAELLLYPEERDEERIGQDLEILKQAPGPILSFVEAFLAEPASRSVDEYVTTLELSPPCPLYVGAYLFDEPKSCRGAGMSGRNAYMIEVANVYKHFGFEINGRELADFLPVMVEFLAITLDRSEMDRIGLRRYFVEHHLLIGLGPLAEALRKYESPYELLVNALKLALTDDLALAGDQPAWTKPVDEPEQSVTCPMRLEIPSPKSFEPASEVKQ